MLAVNRAMQLIEALAQAPEGKGVIELSEQLRLHKADVSRILSTLQEMGYVVQDERSGQFSIAFKFIALALAYQDKIELEDIVRPVLTELVHAIGESVQFAVEQNQEFIYVDRVDGIKPIRVASMLGQLAPLHATAVGKVWLASLPDDTVRDLVEKRGMPPITEYTITDVATLLKELENVRALGYAVSREEVNLTVVGVAGPVHDRQHHVRASVVATLPVFEATDERVETVAAQVLASAKVLSDRLSVLW